MGLEAYGASEVKAVDRRIIDFERISAYGTATTLLRAAHDGYQVRTVNTATDQWPRRHRITVEEYQRMAEARVLAPEARVELIEGEIIDMAPIGTDHAYVVNRLTRLLAKAVGEDVLLAVQQAVQLGPHSQPQPDLSLARGPEARYRRSHPQPSDILLIIEVSDSTLSYDRNVKVPLYARHGIPELWLIDVNTMQLHCMCQPQSELYRSTRLFTGGGIELAELPGVVIDLSSVLVAG